MAERITQVATAQYDELIGGANPNAVATGITIAAGEGNLTRGTLLKFDAGKYKGATDADEVVAVLCEDVDATHEVNTEAYFTGVFNAEKLKFKSGTGDISKVIDSMHKYGMLVVKLHK